jgi:hypothetical protein
MVKRSLVIAVLALVLIGMSNAANYMYKKASVKGVGYTNVEKIISTQTGFSGQKLVEKESGSGNIITERTELEAEKQLDRLYLPLGAYLVDGNPQLDFSYYDSGWGCKYPTGVYFNMDYINFTKEAEFEFMPVSYQTGTYDQKWLDKLCVQNYRIGSVLTEMYTHAEHLQKTSEVKTRGFGSISFPVKFRGYLTMKDFIEWKKKWDIPFKYIDYPRVYEAPQSSGKEIFPMADASYPPCCTGVLEANLNSNVIGVAHIGWISRDPLADDHLKGRHAEYGRSVEDLTGAFSIEKFIQLWGNSTCGAISVDWLPCM